MTGKTFWSLAGIVAVLVAVFLVLEYGRNSPATSKVLLPDLKSQINEVTSLVIRNANGTITVHKSDDGWTVAERNDYVADVGTLRELLLAIADARVVETKTSNPDKYHIIGVNDPSDEDSESIELTIVGDEFEHVVILGSEAQSNYRHARLTNAQQSVLIDQNPDVPGSADDWLATGVVDIATERVRQVMISHADGEEVVIEKQSADAGFFELINMPDGRELSYSTVTNGIGAALADLTLDDVRPAPTEQAMPVTTTVIETFDGLRVDVSAYEEDDAAWLSFAASATDVAEADVEEEAGQINARVGGWQYALPDYKANLLKRRLEDLLKAKD